MRSVYRHDYGLHEVVEVHIPARQTSSTCWIQVGTGWDRPEAVAVDAAGDVFVADEGPPAKVVASSRAGCIHGLSNCQITISNLLVYGIAVDAKGDVFYARPQR